MTIPKAYQELCELARECAIVESIDALLGWDEQTMLPPMNGQYRAQQMKYVAGLIHNQRTNPKWTQLLDELENGDWRPNPNSDQHTTLKQLRRKVDRAARQPKELVQDLAEATVIGQQVWAKARKENCFADFLPALRKIVELKQQQADALGHKGNRYDALLDEYEPLATTEAIEIVLSELKQKLVPLIQRIAESQHRPSSSVVRGPFPIENQRKFATQAATAIGFDFQRGRLDVTTHPFCTEMGPNDCRITTRYDEVFFNTAFFGVLHEAGHGMYEQGLRSSMYGLPSGQYCSLGIHESQSRLWENMVGRSFGFWEHFYPSAQSLFPEPLNGGTCEEFYAAVNAVEPSLIRVEADEATYNLHIIIRFELEQELISGNLPVEDLPQAWRQKYHDALGVTPETDRDGCLQDVHWSVGLFGYFPTYSLGNLYAAQLFQQAENELGDLQLQFRDGKFDLLHQWLNEKIYSHGQNYPADKLVENATGHPLSSQPFYDYLFKKLGPIYQL